MTNEDRTYIAFCTFVGMGDSEGEAYEKAKALATSYAKMTKKRTVDMAKPLEERKAEFKDECKPYLKIYPAYMVHRFYDYWTETNKSGKKMRFEMRETFEMARRMRTFASNGGIKPKVEKKEDMDNFMESYK